MAKIFTFKENDITVSGEQHHLIELARYLREAGVEGTWSDLIYQIEYLFDIDGVRTSDPECNADFIAQLQIGDIIAVQDNLYEYGGYENADSVKGLRLHKVYTIEIDEDGVLTATYNSWYFTDEEMANRNIKLTQKQWIGLAKFFIRERYKLSSEKISDAANDIVCRCFSVTGAPKIESLCEYIDNYFDR